MKGSFMTSGDRAPAKSRGQATPPPVTRSPHVLNDSFRSSDVLNDSFKTPAHRCAPHRPDFAGPLTSGEVNDPFMTLSAGVPGGVGWCRLLLGVAEP
ncbi:hypothetical protein, partial [Amycolatopsis lexingtonensis]|uniref:hypothetical protein n=1 Tax=Amycolatopsis lexingtonensis TaxID=218822 RepID=UPI001B80012B